MKVICSLIYLFFILLPVAAFATSDRKIYLSNADSIVYLEIDDSKGGIIESGTGFIVSHDGWIVTAAHLKPTTSQSMWAVVGARGGVRYKLEYRDSDDRFDVALWQLPQSESCWSAAALSRKHVALTDHVLVIGFPGTMGLSPTPSTVTNLHGELGFYKVSGLLEGGNSGGPVFNEQGKVVAIVQGGTLPGTDNNDLVPVAVATSLLARHNVDVGIDTTIPPCAAAVRDTASTASKDTNVAPAPSENQHEGTSVLTKELSKPPSQMCSDDELYVERNNKLERLYNYFIVHPEERIVAIFNSLSLQNSHSLYLSRDYQGFSELMANKISTVTEYNLSYPTPDCYIDPTGKFSTNSKLSTFHYTVAIKLPRGLSSGEYWITHNDGSRTWSGLPIRVP